MVTPREAVAIQQRLAPLARRQILVLKQPDPTLIGIVVEFIDQQNVGTDDLDDLRHALDLTERAGLQFGHETARGASIHRCVERGDADTGVCGTEDGQEQSENQQNAKGSR